MAANFKNLTRLQLYEEVWSVPMRTLARKYNLSDRGLAKICKQMEVPVPGVGYWRKVESGQNPDKQPLTPQDGESKVNANILNPLALHPLIQETMAAFEKFDVPRDHWAVSGVSSPRLNIRTSTAAQARALFIMNKAILGLLSENATVAVVRQEEKFITEVQLNNERAAIYLKQTSDYASSEASEFEIGITGAEFRDLHEEIRTLDWTRRSSRTRPRTCWRDLKYEKLEKSISSFVYGTIYFLREQKKLRDERDVLLSKREKEEAANELAKKKYKEKREAIKQLEMQSDCNIRAEKIRAFLDKVELAFNKGELKPKAETKFKDWITKNRKLADALDPITGGWSDTPPDFAKQEEIRFFFRETTRKVPAWVYLKK